MDSALATAILKVAQEADYYSSALPEDEEALVAEGQYMLDTAQNAFDQGIQVEAVLQILRLSGWEEGEVQEASPAPADTDLTAEQQAEANAETEAELAEPEESSPEAAAEAVGDLPPSSPSPPAPETFVTATGEKLPVPPEIEGEAAPMPRDMTSESDRHIRRLHSEYNAFLARVTWLISLKTADVRNATYLRDDAFRQIMLSAKRDATEKMTQAEADAIANEDATVKQWNADLRKHEDDLERFKALKEIYKGHVDRLSREMSMRTDEFGRSGGR